MYYFNYFLTLFTCAALTSGLPGPAASSTAAENRTTAGSRTAENRAAAKDRTTWIVQSNSSLSINGKTNVSRFSCGVAQYGEPDTIKFLNEGCRGNSGGIPLCGVLKINVSDFDCRNRMMTGEFKKTLQYQKYPQLKIIFLNLEKMPSFGNKPELLKGQVIIELAGISRQFEIDYTAAKDDTQSATLAGSRQLSFSDFSLMPPQKMGGLIRVSETLDVQFILCLRKLE